LLAGFIPEASRKDALEFAEGVARKHCMAPDNSFFGVIAWRGGYAYEVQEGGGGYGLLASVLAEFDKDPGDPENPPATVAYVQTHVRMAKISRTNTGLGAVALPEGQTTQLHQSEFVRAGARLSPMVPDRTAVLVSGVAFLALTSAVFMFASWGRIQPYAKPGPTTVLKAVATVERLPIGQLAGILAGGAPVIKIEFKNNKWEVLRAGDAVAPASAPRPGVPGRPSPSSAASAKGAVK
jgi:hypothetical protein